MLLYLGARLWISALIAASTHVHALDSSPYVTPHRAPHSDHHFPSRGNLYLSWQPDSTLDKRTLSYLALPYSIIQQGSQISTPPLSHAQRHQAKIPSPTRLILLLVFATFTLLALLHLGRRATPFLQRQGYRDFTDARLDKMPLVVPGLQGNDGDQLSGWASKLMGKKIGEQHDETTFAKTDLPKKHRILKQGDMATMDFEPERLNVHVDDKGVVKDVKHG